MTNRILVPVDGSPLSFAAFEMALDEHPDAEIVVLHVVDPTEPGYSVPTDVDLDTRYEPLHGSERWFERARAATDDLFDRIEARAADADAGDRVTTASAVGDPVRAIVDRVVDDAIDRVFVGGHGRSDDAVLMLGRVAELVVARAPVPVTVVRNRPARDTDSA